VPLFKRGSVAIAAALVVVAGVRLSAQSTFQFAVSVVDGSGTPVTDLGPEDVFMSENGVRQPVVRVEPLSLPMKLTIAVDNGFGSGEALVHYRAGLTALVQGLPREVEVTLITTAPQPRTIVKPTTNRTEILRGIGGFAPEEALPRFSDALVEFSERLRAEGKDRLAARYLPVLVMVATGATEARSYRAEEIQKAVEFLAARGAKVNSIVVSTSRAGTTTINGLDFSQQSIVAIPAAKATNGRYEGLASLNRLETLLKQWGHDLAVLHGRQIKQFRVTVERTQGGELQNPRIEIARPGVTGTVTRDGYLP
jgi:hypothetical protein